VSDCAEKGFPSVDCPPLIQSRINGQEGSGQFLMEGPYDVIHDVIACKSYIFPDSQGSRLFFPVVENVLTQMHTQLAARSKC